MSSVTFNGSSDLSRISLLSVEDQHHSSSSSSINSQSNDNTNIIIREDDFDINTNLDSKQELNPDLLDQLRAFSIIGLGTEMVKWFQNLFEPTQSRSDQDIIETLQSVFSNDSDSLVSKSREYIPTQVPNLPFVTKQTMTTILDILVRIGMVKRPEHFQSDSGDLLEDSSSEDRQYKIFHNFSKDFRQNALNHWVNIINEKINSDDQLTPAQKGAAYKSIEGMQSLFNYIGSDRIFDRSQSPLYKGVNTADLQELKTLSNWLELEENFESPDYGKYYQEFSTLEEKVEQQKNTNLKSIAEYSFDLLKTIDPKFQDAARMEDVITIVEEKHRCESRKEFEEYFKNSFPKKDLFEANALRQFWETLYTKQYGSIFYEIVGEALDLSNRESSFHQSILQLWYLSLIDTIHAYPKEARSRMPELSFAGIPAPNFGYNMVHSTDYAQWLNDPIARASADIIMDGFYWIADWGASLDIEAFLFRMYEQININKKFNTKAIVVNLDAPISQEITESCSNPYPYDHFIRRFAFFFLENVCNKKFISNWNHNIFSELLRAFEERKSENPIEALLEEAEISLKNFKKFAENMRNLRAEGNDKEVRNSGLVFGIGFNGKLFKSPSQREGKEGDEIWIAFAESGRAQPGGKLFLAFLEDLVKAPSQQFCNDVLKSKAFNTYYNKYQSFILFQLKQEKQKCKEQLKQICSPRIRNFYTKQLSFFSSFAAQLEQNAPFEELDNRYKQWIQKADKWYRVPCEVKIAANEMIPAEKKAHESAREVVLHAAVKRSFAPDYPQLMPLLMNHWKEELIEMMCENEDKFPSELANKVNGGASLTDQEKKLVYELIDSLIWEIHRTLEEFNQKLIYKELEEFIVSKTSSLVKDREKLNKPINRKKREKETLEKRLEELKKIAVNNKSHRDTEEGIKKVEELLKKGSEHLERITNQRKCITNQLEMLNSPLSLWENEVFEEFKNKFLKEREVGQCVEPLFAKVLGHSHFFPVYLSRSKPVSCIPDAANSSHDSDLQLGNRHPKYVTPPCYKNCQINALAHLYTFDLLREDQSADLLNTIRKNHLISGVPERIFSIEKLNAYFTSQP